jgi:antitoxin CptB|tara:strand:+ start:5463 stop:5729 length:267 start_codon:yes stop_codon:yes gene_type:complete
MTLNKEELKNKIIYRSAYRGSKEMDILLSNFVKKVINHLDDQELMMLDELINTDDENLFKFNKNLQTTVEIKENKISQLFKNFKLKDI